MSAEQISFFFYYTFTLQADAIEGVERLKRFSNLYAQLHLQTFTAGGIYLLRETSVGKLAWNR